MAITLNGCKAAVRTALDTYFGPIPSGISPAEAAAIDKQRDNLSFTIATAAVYVQENAEVNPGIPVATTGSASAQTGETTAPGSLS